MVARSELEGGSDLLITALPHSVLVDRLVFRLHHDGSNDLSNEAARRGRAASTYSTIRVRRPVFSLSSLVRPGIDR